MLRLSFTIRKRSVRKSDAVDSSAFVRRESLQLPCLRALRHFLEKPRNAQNMLAAS